MRCDRKLHFPDVREQHFLCALCHWYICSLTAFTRSHRRLNANKFRISSWLAVFQHAHLYSFDIIETLAHSLPSSTQANMIEMELFASFMHKWNSLNWREFTKLDFVFYDTFYNSCLQCLRRKFINNFIPALTETVFFIAGLTFVQSILKSKVIKHTQLKTVAKKRTKFP